MPRNKRESERRAAELVVVPIVEYETVREAKDAYLKAFRECGIHAHAAAQIGYARQTVSKWKQRDPKFAEEAEEAYEQSWAAAEAEVRRRAMGYTDKDGKRRESDLLMMFMLKAKKPEYRDRVELPPPPEPVSPVDWSLCTIEELRALAKLRDDLAARATARDVVAVEVGQLAIAQPEEEADDEE